MDGSCECIADSRQGMIIKLAVGLEAKNCCLSNAAC
jgi:hypothetical protein